MKGLEAIKNQILSDARAESDKQLKEAQDKAEAKKASRLAAEKKNLAGVLKKNSDEARMKKERLLTTANLEARKKLLSTKQEMIEKAFSGVEKKFAEMQPDEYLKFIKDVIKDYAETGSEKVMFSSEEQKLFSEDFLKEVNGELKKVGKKGELTYAEKTGTFTRGVVLLGKNSEINCTLQSLLRQVKQSLEAEVAEILFR